MPSSNSVIQVVGLVVLEIPVRADSALEPTSLPHHPQPPNDHTDSEYRLFAHFDIVATGSRDNLPNSSIMPLSAERDLPEELLAEIISFCPQDTLAALCRTCKRMNRIATARLYASVILRPNAEPEAGAITLTPFAYLVFKSPAHAALVQSITVPETFGGTGEEMLPIVLIGYGKEEQLWPEFGTAGLEEVLKKKCAGFAANDAEANEIYEKLRGGGDEDGIFALLIASLPNLRRLDADVGELIDHDAFHSLMKLITSRVRSFDKASNPESPLATAFSAPIDVMVKADTDKYPNDPNQLTPFFHLPNLRSIYGVTMGDSEYQQKNNPFELLKPRSCPIEYMEFRSSKLSQENLQHIFDAAIPGKLKAINYEVGCAWAWCAVNHSSMVKSLEAHYKTLKSLGFTHEEFYPYQFDPDTSFGEAGDKPFAVSFTCFETLKRLKVAPVFVWGHAGLQSQERFMQSQTREMLWKALPASLEELWIARAVDERPKDEAGLAHFAPDCLLPALDLMLEHRSESFPNLSRILLQTSVGNWRDAWLDVLCDFCARAEAQGISCIVVADDINENVRGDDDGDVGDFKRKWGWDEEVEWQTCMFDEEGPRLRVVAKEEADLGARLRSLKANIG
jgi:hypothetical protein